MKARSYVSSKPGLETSRFLLRSLWFAAGAAGGLALLLAASRPESYGTSAIQGLAVKLLAAWVLPMGAKDILLALAREGSWRKLESHMATVFAAGIGVWALGERGGAWLAPLAPLGKEEVGLLALGLCGAVALASGLYKGVWAQVERNVFGALPNRSPSLSSYRNRSVKSSEQGKEATPATKRSLRKIAPGILAGPPAWSKPAAPRDVLPFVGPAYTLGLFLWLRFNPVYARLFVGEETKSFVAGEPLLSGWFLPFLTQALPTLIAAAGVSVFVMLLWSTDRTMPWSRWAVSTLYCLFTVFYIGLLLSL